MFLTIPGIVANKLIVKITCQDQHRSVGEGTNRYKPTRNLPLGHCAVVRFAASQSMCATSHEGETLGLQAQMHQGLEWIRLTDHGPSSLLEQLSGKVCSPNLAHRVSIPWKHEYSERNHNRTRNKIWSGHNVNGNEAVLREVCYRLMEGQGVLRDWPVGPCAIYSTSNPYETFEWRHIALDCCSQDVRLINN